MSDKERKAKRKAKKRAKKKAKKARKAEKRVRKKLKKKGDKPGRKDINAMRETQDAGVMAANSARSQLSLTRHPRIEGR